MFYSFIELCLIYDRYKLDYLAHLNIINLSHEQARTL